MIRYFSAAVSTALPTAFHHFLDGLAKEGLLLRHYTQNIDCLEHHLPALNERTTWLHGRIDQAKCHHCGSTTPLVPSAFTGNEPPECVRCQDVALERHIMGKRSRGVGRLRPNIVLYGEENLEGEAIGEMVEEDLAADPMILIVAGTSLRVPGARQLVKEFSRTIQARGGLAIWMNKEAPPAKLNVPWDYAWQVDCDQVIVPWVGQT